MEVLSLSKSNKKNILSLLAGIATDEENDSCHRSSFTGYR